MRRARAPPASAAPGAGASSPRWVRPRAVGGGRSPGRWARPSAPETLEHAAFLAHSATGDSANHRFTCGDTPGSRTPAGSHALDGKCCGAGRHTRAAQGAPGVPAAPRRQRLLDTRHTPHAAGGWRSVHGAPAARRAAVARDLERGVRLDRELVIVRQLLATASTGGFCALGGCTRMRSRRAARRRRSGSADARRARSAGGAGRCVKCMRRQAARPVRR